MAWEFSHTVMMVITYYISLFRIYTTCIPTVYGDLVSAN